MAIYDDVTAALVSAGLGQISDASADWMIYTGRLQDSDPASVQTVADRAIALFETSGDPPLEAWAIDYPGLQIVVRGEPDGYQAATVKIRDIYNFLHAGEVEINAGVSPPSATYVYFYATTSGPISMGFDERRRPKLAWNYRAMQNRP